VLPEHDRPRDQAENAEQDDNHLADGIAADEELPWVGGRKDGRQQYKRAHAVE
jgi:hypothetical protein